MLGLKRLKAIRELSQKNPEWIHKDLFGILRKDDIWIAAYENIKGNKVLLPPAQRYFATVVVVLNLRELVLFHTTIIDKS